MKEMKSCPFCGGTKFTIDKKSKRVGSNGLGDRVELHTYSVRCNRCHARGASCGGRVIVGFRTYRWDAPDVELSLPDWATTDEKLEAGAIEAWNNRYNGGDTDE